MKSGVRSAGNATQINVSHAVMVDESLAGDVSTRHAATAEKGAESVVAMIEESVAVAIVLVLGVRSDSRARQSVVVRGESVGNRGHARVVLEALRAVRGEVRYVGVAGSAF